MLDIQLSPFTPLRTERLLLRELSLDDTSGIFALRSNDQVMQYLDRPKMQQEEEARQLIRNILGMLEKNEGITWAITRAGESQLIGTIVLFHFDAPNHRGEIGYMLHEDFHRQGYMQEAITAVIEYAFRTLNFHTLEANINPHNVASRAILEKNGFVQEAHHKENYYYKGKFLDSVIFSRINPYH